MTYRPQIREAVINVLKTCKGKDNAISAANLFVAATGETVVPSIERNQTRVIRSIVNDLRREKVLPIISGNGYWLAESDAELEAFTLNLLRQAETKFGLARTLSKVPVSSMVKQHNFNFTDQDNQEETNHV